MPLSAAIKEHRELTKVLRTDNEAGEARELKEQGAELKRMEEKAHEKSANYWSKAKKRSDKKKPRKNKYLNKIAETSDNSWVIPPLTATIPIMGYGIAKHNDFGIQLKHEISPYRTSRLKDQMKANKKVTGALAGAAMGATALAELSRRKYQQHQSEVQTNKLAKKIEDIVHE